MPSSNQHKHRHSFSHTTSQRRASVLTGSLGRAGIFVPSDFIDTSNIAALGMAAGSGGGDDAIGSANSTSTSTDQQYSSQLMNEEVQLLNANGIPVYGASASSENTGLQTVISPSNRLFHVRSHGDEEALLNNNTDAINTTWENAIESDKLQKSSFLLETRALILASIPLIVTFVFENSLSVASIFSVGHLGSRELAAVSLGAMTANITAYSIIQGLATSLDTLCSQAYGAQNYRMVGVHFQKCTALIFAVFIPIFIMYWVCGGWILSKLIPDHESALLASHYLRVVSLGIPGYILFETGKRFLQSQGIYHASTYILCICAPLNGLMNYLFVWNKYIGIGYLGAPIAVAINYWLMALGLFAYTIYTPNPINPMKCWSVISFEKLFTGWSALFKLALPGVIMVEAEFLAFEMLTLFSSYLGTDQLAAQSILTTTASLSYQVPFAVSIASATRVANLLGASLKNLALVHCKISLIFSFLVSSVTFSLLYFGSNVISRFFTNDETNIAIVSEVIPLVAVIQIFDALNAVSAGLLRGQGLQKIGGIVNLISYYLLGVPVALILTFKFGYGLQGLWIGAGLALLVIGVVQSYYVLSADWDQLVKDAERRNNA